VPENILAESVYAAPNPLVFCFREPRSKKNNNLFGINKNYIYLPCGKCEF
jgi:hypothetical protein